MKVIKLYGMLLENFKGISKLEYNFEGNDVIVEGDNGTGKTTLFDAFLWCLFGKDSSGRKDFQVKTIVNGEEVHNLDHSVSLQLNIDGNNKSFKRTFKEVYKKSRGGLEVTFNGHKTIYEVDGVPCNEKEYKKHVDALVNEEVFKLITNPLYFNSLKWQDQRKILFEMVNGEEVDVYKFNEELEFLKPLLEQHSLEELKAIQVAKRKKIKEQVDTIPSRIDELNSMNNSSLEGAGEAEKEIEKIDLYVDDLRGQIARIKSGYSLVDLQRKLDEKNKELFELDNNSKVDLRNELDIVSKGLDEVITNGQKAKLAKQELEFKLKDAENKITLLRSNILDIKDSQDKLREIYYAEQEKQLEFEHSSECPTCNQKLPSESVEEAHNKALKDFEENKKNTLMSIKQKGISLKQDAEQKEDEIRNIENFKEEFNDSKIEVDSILVALVKSHEELSSRKNELKNQLEEKSETEEMIAIKKEIKELTVKLADEKTNAQDIINDLENDVSINLKRKNELNAIVGQKYAVEANKKRIEELQSQLQEYIKDFDNVDRILYLISEYKKVQVESLSDKINELFSITDFKLFNKLVNGEYEETCEALHNGIPYNKNLNTAARINVGLDIINALSKHYNVQACIFIDNAESVTKSLDINSQKVLLYVKQGQEKLNFKGVI